MPTMLKCKHYIHPGCAEGMVKLECPMCRAPLDKEKALTKKIRDGILENKKKYKEEQEREEFENIFGSISLVDFEIHLAVSFLEHQGFPPSFIPSRIERTPFVVQPPPGSVFQTVVAGVLKLMDIDEVERSRRRSETLRARRENEERLRRVERVESRLR